MVLTAKPPPDSPPGGGGGKEEPDRISREEIERLAGVLGVADAALFLALWIRRESAAAPSCAVLRWKVEGCEEEMVVPIPLANGDGGGDDEDEGFYVAQIMKALAASPFAVTRKQLAQACHRKGKSSHKGRWGQTVSRLADTHKILHRGDLYTDDVNKFPEGD